MSEGPPKRDKFAALAQQQASAQESSTPSQAPAPKQQRGGDKLAAMARGGSDSLVAAPKEEESQDSKEEKEKEEAWKQRMNQRQAIWKDMEQAEALTIRLLQLAQETSQSLAETTMTAIDKEQLSRMAAEYRTALMEIHQRLSPHAPHVKAYQARPSRINRMYQARVDLRLAEEKRDLCQEFLRLEQQQQQTETKVASPEQQQVSSKRKRED